MQWKRTSTRCDILNLEWVSSGRDREVASLICYALRQKGYHVVEASVFNYKHYIHKYRPKLLYIGDPRGALKNQEAVRYGRKLGIPVVTFSAEGDYNTYATEDGFWGVIHERNLEANLYMLWSTKSRDFVQGYRPNLASQIKVSGAVGFDRYQIYKFMTKAELLSKYNLEYSHVIGYAGWAFDRYFKDPVSAELIKHWTQDGIVKLRKIRHAVHAMLRTLIESNSDKLFLLKEHPGVADPEFSELAGLDVYPNVLYFRNEEAIADCINSCDVWTAFESTTCLEAWLLGKPTLLLKPLDIEFSRSAIYTGSPHLATVETVQSAFEQLFQENSFLAFAAKQATRDKIIQDILQWADGKNHMRAATFIADMLPTIPTQSYAVAYKDKLDGLLWHLFLEGSLKIPAMRKKSFSAQKFATFNHPSLIELTQRYQPFLDLFYRKNALTPSDLANLAKINT